MTNVRCSRLMMVCLVIMGIAGAGCTSVGNAGLLMHSAADPLKVVKAPYRDLGFVEETGCRFLIIGIVPAGNADPSDVLNKALRKKGADALINATTSNSLYGFIPIYNVFSITCTTVKGTAISFEPAASS